MYMKTCFWWTKNIFCFQLLIELYIGTKDDINNSRAILEYLVFLANYLAIWELLLGISAYLLVRIACTHSLEKWLLYRKLWRISTIFLLPEKNWVEFIPSLYFSIEYEIVLNILNSFEHRINVCRAVLMNRSNARR